MLDVHVEGDTLKIGEVQITFHRTLRLPDDGSDYPLPPSLGAFPLLKVADYADRVPEAWRKHGGVFFPMYQREACWLSFAGSAYHKPHALKVAVGKINAVSGERWHQRLDRGRGQNQDYLVVPKQPWLDGINSGNGRIRQFVAMPLGMGYTVEGQLTGEEVFGGIQLISYAPKPGRFPDRPPAGPFTRRGWFDWSSQQTVSDPFAGTPFIGSVKSFGIPQNSGMCAYRSAHSQLLASCNASFNASSPVPSAGTEMGLAAGGKMIQKIYADEHGVDTWDQDNYGRVFVHICNSTMFEEITGRRPPASPVSARTYTEHGYPWFSLYDENQEDVPASSKLAGVKSVKKMDKKHGFKGQQDDRPVKVKKKQIKKQTLPELAGSLDGNW